MTAGIEHAVVGGQGPVPGDRRDAVGDVRIMEGDRAFAAEGRERAVADVVVERPELPRTQVDIRERNVGRSRPVDPSRHTHAPSLGGSSPADAESSQKRTVSYTFASARAGFVVAHMGAEPTCRTTLYDVRRADRRGVARRQHPDVDALARPHVGRSRPDPR